MLPVGSVMQAPRTDNTITNSIPVTNKMARAKWTKYLKVPKKDFPKSKEVKKQK